MVTVILDRVNDTFVVCCLWDTMTYLTTAAAALFSTVTSALHAGGALRVRGMSFGNFMAFVAFQSEQENIFNRALLMTITVNHLLSFRPVCL